MKRPNDWLTAHARDVNSQSGEDGILEKILEMLPDTNRWSIEFGAWDGRHLSNTWTLIANKGYSGVLIEADPRRFETLKERIRDYPGVIAINAFVGFGPSDNLDALLEGKPVPENPDLLSIDVDGSDYHIWEATRRTRPKVVVVEHNPTIATGVEFVQARSPRVMQGASAESLRILGKKKHYELVAVTRFNCIFVDEKYFSLFEIEDNSVRALRSDESLVTHVFCGYDGRIFFRGYGKLPWHDVTYDEALGQQLPRVLRDWRENYGTVQSKLFGAYKRWRRLRERRP